MISLYLATTRYNDDKGKYKKKLENYYKTVLFSQLILSFINLHKMICVDSLL